MEKFLLLIVCLASGVVLRRSKRFDENSPIILNQVLIYFFIPVLTLYHIPRITFNPQQIWLSVTPFIVYASSFVCMKIMARIGSLDRPTEGALIMCSGIGSISFVGFPVFELLYGQQGLSYGLVLSLAGTFVVFNTVGISTGFYYAQQTRVSLWFFVKKIFSFPPFLAFLLGSILNLCNYSYPPLVDSTLYRLSSPFSVLALIAIGMQIHISMDKTFWKTLLIGQVHKLIFAPFLIYVFMWYIVGVDTLIGKICVLGAAIGSMNAISIIAAQMGLNPRLATAMPAIGIPASIPLLFFIDQLIS